jgi:hypothetical protein
LRKKRCFSHCHGRGYIILFTTVISHNWATTGWPLATCVMLLRIIGCYLAAEFSEAWSVLMLICNSSKAFTSQSHRLKGISDPDAVPSVKAIDRRPRPASYTSQHWWLFVGSSILTRSS